MQDGAICEQHDGAQQLHDSEPGLMNAEDYGSSFRLRHRVQQIDYLVSRGAVQPRCRLVEDQHLRLVDHLEADGHAPPLPAGDPAHPVVADSGAGDVAEAELLHEELDPGGELRLRELEAELGTEREGLLDGEEWE